MLLWVLSLMAAGEPAPVQVRLVYVRGAEALDCPTEQAFRDGVIARLGADPFVGSAPLQIVAQLERDPKGYQATLELLRDAEAPRVRTLRSESCAELSESLLLAVALAIDPQLMLRPAPSPDVVPAPRAEARPAPVSTPGAPVQFRWELGAQLGLGLTPPPTVGFAAALGVHRGVFELLAEGRVALPSRVPVSMGSVALQPLAGSLLPCFVASFGLGACAQLGAGALRVDGQFPGGTQDIKPLFLAGARVQYALALKWGLELAVRLSALVVPTQLTVFAASRPVWVTSPVTGELGFAITGLH
jgi:hypothetical protein